MTAGPLFLDLSPRLAGHIATALRSHGIWLRSMGMRSPDGLVELESMCASRAKAGQEGTPLADLWRAADDQAVTPRLLTYADCARSLAVSERTVKRLIGSGALRAVRVGSGASRVRVTDLDVYVETLSSEESRAA